MQARTFFALVLLPVIGCGDDAEATDSTTTTTTTTTTGDGTTTSFETGTDTQAGTGTATDGLTGTGTETETETDGMTGTTGEPAAMVGLEPVVDQLVAPTGLVTAPDGTMVVLDQTGLAYRIVEGGAPEMFADLRDRLVELEPEYDERGLLGMAFHPAYPEDRRVYVYYSAPLRGGAPETYDHTNVLAEFEVDEQGVLNTEMGRQVLALDWPAGNHNGGSVRFGPDDMLYLALGDGGEANDVGPGHPAIGNGQDWTTLMGSIIRIDPDGGEPYGIPADNPFVGEHEGADEIWAYGLRNPFAFAFDTETGALFAGDVGQNLMEEVDIIEAGNNYGWNIKEGTLCFDPNDADEPLPACLDGGPNGEPLVDPILTYTHPDTIVSGMSEIQGITVLGGRVYRGALLDELYGAYVFGDYSRSFTEPEGQLLVGLPDGESWTLEQLPVEGSGPDHLGRFVRGFGEDADGELYVLTSDESGPNGSTGMVWRLTRAESP